MNINTHTHDTHAHRIISCVKSDPFLHGSPVLLIVTHAESDSCALYLMDCSAANMVFMRYIIKKVLSSMQGLQRTPRLQRSMPPRASGHQPAAPGHSPKQFRLRWLRPILTGEFARSLVLRWLRLILTGEFARSLVLFQKGLFGLPVSLSVVPAVLFDGFTLQFVPAGLDHCVQHNLPLWAQGDVMRLLQRHLEVMVDSKFC